MQEKDIRRIIEEILRATLSEMAMSQEDSEERAIEDITQTDLKKQYLVPEPANAKGFLEAKSFTPARLGIWRTGPRYKTSTMLHFRADHSAARDAVFSKVSQECLDRYQLFTVNTLCQDKNEYLTRPDKGREISKEGQQMILETCKKEPTVQLVVGDGLSATAIESNLGETLPSILQGLKSYGIDVGTPFFIQYARVGVMDHVAKLLRPKVTCILIGERPGLVTAQSMSAYMIYGGHQGVLESQRTVVSNIHRGGMIPAEAGAYIAEIIDRMLKEKVSGTELVL